MFTTVFFRKPRKCLEIFVICDCRIFEVCFLKNSRGWDGSFVFKAHKSISDQAVRPRNTGIFCKKYEADIMFIFSAIQFSECLQDTKAKFFP